MVTAGQQATGRRRVVIVLDAARARDTYRVEAPDRVLRMFGLLEAAWDELDLTTVPPQDRTRVQRLLETVSAELERSVSPALADELHELVRHAEAVPSTAELRIEYSSLLGWASGLVAAMLDQLAAARDKLYLLSQAAGTPPGQGHDGIGTAAVWRTGRRADPLADDTLDPRPR
jgi:Protein of unknown function (DUF2587)